MIESRILALGSFRPEDVEVSFSEESARKKTPEIDNYIQVCWEQMLVEAKEKGKTIWNGTTYRVEDLELTSPHSFKVRFAPIDFKTRECLPTFAGYSSLPEEYHRKGAYVGAFVKTADDFFVFVELSGLSTNKNKVDLLGGIVGDDFEVRTGEDLFNVLYKEIEEEAAIPKETIENCTLRVVYLNSYTNVGFHFDVALRDTKEEVYSRYLQNGKDKDISGLLFVPQEKLADQLAAMSGSKVFLKELYFSR